MPGPSSPPPASVRKTLYPGGDEPLLLPKQRARSPAASISSLPYRSNVPLSNLFASTSGLASSRGSGASTPTTAAGTLDASTLVASDGRSVSPIGAATGAPADIRNLIFRGFAPHVAVVASADTDSLLRNRGFRGGFLELVRPFGELVVGRVTVRDSIGASRSWDDFGVRFVGIRDALNAPRIPGSGRPSFESRSSEANGSSASSRSRSSYEVRRVGGDIVQIEDVVERHLNFAELRAGTHDESGLKSQSETPAAHLPAWTTSPFYTLYLRRLLSGLPLTPHETFTHPVACVIAISSRNPSPIEEFKRLYASTDNGDNRLPHWVNNTFLRYYVLVHDEDNDDIAKSTALYEQMKRHFGLHCHLLRLRSAQCVPSDDDSLRLPQSEWIAASEEIAAIQKRETSDDLEDPTPCIFESDVTALRTFVRELVTQSIVPGMERLCAQWNEQVANRRRGISGRLMSISKRWAPFGSSRTPSSPISGFQGGASSGSNYDTLQGFYRPDAPEALMRKLADYSFMLRDFKLAQSTYDLVRTDFEHDKAWKHYAGANEMCLVATLLNPSSRSRQDSIERWLEGACHSYIHRCNAPFYALRTLLLAAECLKFRGSLGVDEPAAWAAKILEMNLAGQVGSVLITERIAGFFAQKKVVAPLSIGARNRKRGFWNLLAAEAWVRMGKSVQAERCLEDVRAAFGIANAGDDAQLEAASSWMAPLLQEQQQSIVALRLENLGLDLPGGDDDDEGPAVVEEVSEDLGFRANRRSVIESAAVLPAEGGLEAMALTPVRTRESQSAGENEGFE